MKRSIISLGILLSVFAAARANAIGLEVAVGGWAQDPDGKVAYQHPLVSDGLGLVDEAGYDEENRFSGRAKLDLPILPNFYFMVTPMEFEGNGSKSFSFGGANIAGDFYSKSTLDHYDLAMYFEMPLLETASLDTFNLEFGINVRILDVDIIVQETSGTDSEQVSETLYVPMVYLGMQFRPIEAIAFEAEVRGIEYNNSSYYDLIGRLKYKFAGPAFLAVGYRHELIEIDEEDILADFEFSGPFAELGFQF